MAGVAALLNTKLGSAQGNLNPMLYRLAASNPSAFHDVTLASSGVSDCTSATPSMCNNSTPSETSLTGGLAGYVVGTGYDQATGLGSLDVAQFLEAAAGGGVTGSTSSFTLAASPSTLSVTPVENESTTSTWTVTGTSVSGFAGTVALSCSVSPVTSQPPSCSVSPSSFSLASGGTAKATVTVTSEGPTNTCLTTAGTGTPAGFGPKGLGGLAMAGLLVLVLPVKKRRLLRGLALVSLLAAGMGALSGCGPSVSGTACSSVVTTGTTAGSYMITVTGTSGSLTETAPLTLTVTVN